MSQADGEREGSRRLAKGKRVGEDRETVTLSLKQSRFMQRTWAYGSALRDEEAEASISRSKEAEMGDCEYFDKNFNFPLKSSDRLVQIQNLVSSESVQRRYGPRVRGPVLH